jgi:tetratricopeptide (TPR) repeat protein
MEEQSPYTSTPKKYNRVGCILLVSLGKKLSGLIICCIWGSTILANSNVDSLKTNFKELPNDTHSINIILTEAIKYINIDCIAYINLVNIAEEKSRLVKNPAFLGRVFYYKGIGLLRLSDLAEAGKYFTMSKIISEKIHNDKLFIASVAELGQLQELNGNIELALKYYSEGLSKAERLTDPVYKGMLLSKMSGLYYKKQEFQKAIIFSRESYQLIQKTNDITNNLTELNNLTMLFSTIGKTDSVEYYLNKSKDLIEQFSLSDPGQMHMYCNNWGDFYMAKHQYKKALHFYFQGEKQAQYFSSPGFIYNSYLNISHAYERMGEYKNALTYYKMFFNMMDSLTSQENFLRGMEIQNKLELQKKENELLRMSRENESSQTQIMVIGKKKNKLINYIVLLTSIILLSVFLIILLIFRATTRKKTYQLLRDKNVQIEQQSKELSKNAKLIAKFQFQMNPRFVFNALHNIQGLIIGKENEGANVQIQRLAELMRKTYNNAEKEYIPLEEEIIYIKTYFRFEANTIHQKIKFNVTVKNELEDILIPPMMIQPFIENSLKHASLDQVKDPLINVNIKTEGDFLEVSIEDNGKGIQHKKEKTDMAVHSIMAIRSRIERIFHSIYFPADREFFSIKTAPERTSGTLVKFYLPLQYIY